MSQSRRRSIPAVDISMDELRSILEHAKALGLPEKEFEVLELLVETQAFLVREIGDKDASIRRLRQLVFGAKTEKKKNVLGKKPEGAEPTPAASPPETGTTKEKPKAKGHGRLGADAYIGAERVKVPHESLRPGDPCPGDCKGRVYPEKDPALLLGIRGSSPFTASVHELERVRCNLCGEVFTAKPPEGVGEEKFDATVASFVAMLRYGSGLPFNRIASLQEIVGIPFPVSTQWELVRDASWKLDPALAELTRQAAQGHLVHNDDTPMKILDHLIDARKREERGEDPRTRTGTFTTGIVSEVGEHRIALYFTGRHHAGENLAQVLAQRASGLDPPLQMCDALERNLPAEIQTIVGNCLAHARRQYVDVAESFPEEVRHVLEEIALVYRVDADAKRRGLSAEDRLRLHQAQSAPVMERLRAWLAALIEERKVEPNSGLGKAVGYVLKRWERLTLFLREAGAPLDNSICERMLKRAITHRKNSLFYKTENGARVGDLYMSLIATAKLSGDNPVDYLTQLQRHAKEVAQQPSAWMPWNYRTTLESAPARA